MEYNYSLGIENPNIKAKMNTQQFKLSEILLDKRYELGLTVDILSQITKESLNNYLKMEYADSDISIDRYIKAINKIYSFQLLSETNEELINTPKKESSYSLTVKNQNLFIELKYAMVFDVNLKEDKEDEFLEKRVEELEKEDINEIK